MQMPGMGELLIVLVIVLLVFGANKLPQLGEGVGKAIKNFKRGINTDDDIDVTPEEKRVAASSSAETLEGEDKQSPQKKQQVQDAEVIENKS